MAEHVSVYRKEHFNAAHRLFNPEWNDEKNAAHFGKCSNPHYHGHNYELVVKVTGPIDADTGYVIDLKYLSDLLREHVVELFDHKNLNVDLPHFRDLNPTAENIAVVIYRIIRPLLDAKYGVTVRLYETERNFVEYPS